MDVEVILNRRELKVLEIDARLPSQTPTAVYHSSGVNLLELLADAFTTGKLPAQLPVKPEQAAIFEHLVVEPNRLKIAGEHVVTAAGPLQHIPDFFGADEALTNYRPGSKSWMATLIITGADMDEALARRNDTIARISTEMKIKRGLED
jgi:3-methylornithine--L-lysine ligase